ncbi:MAG TPA: EamA family transporter [Gemmatimonadales bacterium]|nr:EamA family transporter [Gemmatimonadales bacterium]
MSRPSVVAAFLALYWIWGSTYLGIKVAVETLPPVLLAGVRFVVAGACILAWSRLRGTPWPRGREWYGAVGVGILMVVLNNAAVVWIEQRIASGTVAMFAAGSPLLIALFNSRRLGAPLSRRRMAGLALGTVGLVMLGSATLEEVPDVPRIAMLCFAMVCWAYGMTYGRDWPHAKDVLAASGAQMLAGGLIAVAVGLALGEARSFEFAQVSTRSWLAWAYLTVAGSMIAYTVFQWLLSHTDATSVASYNYVNPIVALALGAWLANEPIGPQTIAATALLIPAVVLVVRGDRRSES